MENKVKKEIPRINSVEFREMVTKGSNRKQLMDHFKINLKSVKEIAKALDINIKREVKPSYILE